MGGDLKKRDTNCHKLTTNFSRIKVYIIKNNNLWEIRGQFTVIRV